MKLRILLALASILLAAACARHHSDAPAPAPTAAHSYPYRKPLTSLGAKFGALPMAVQNCVRAEAGMQEVAEVSKSSTATLVYYKIDFKDPANFPPLYVAADGSVLNPDLTVAIPAPQDASGGLSGGPASVVTIKDLPANVVAVIAERAPGADIDSISKEIWGNHVVYLVSFKDAEHNPKLAVSAEGTVLHQAR
jgi:hypothetical protein